MNSKFAISAILLGMVAMLASATWETIFPPSRIWTPEKSEQLAELGSKTNMLEFALVEAQNNPRMHGGENAAELKKQHDEALTEYDTLHQEFLIASQQPQRMAALLRWGGITLIIIGAVLTFAARGASG